MKQHEALNDGACTLDQTEESRQRRLEQINAEPGSRTALEAVYGQVWDNGELQRDYIVIGFLAPFVVVRRRDNREESIPVFNGYGPLREPLSCRTVRT